MGRFNGKVTRRQVLQALATATAGGALGKRLLRPWEAQAQVTKPKFLVVLACTGGASLLDSFLAVRQSECTDWRKVNTFRDAEVTDIAGSPFRTVRIGDDIRDDLAFIGAIPIGPYHLSPDLMRDFTTRRRNQMLVTTMTGTSVNHTIAQRRSLTGNEAWNGRTLQEAVATHYGEGFTLPNVNMGFMGYIDRGNDPTVPDWAFHEPVAIPYVFPFSLDGARGLQGTPTKTLIDKARALRNDTLDPSTDFYDKGQTSEALARWMVQRGASLDEIERRDLITNLQIAPDLPPNIPLGDYGLLESPDGAKVRAAFPNWLIDPVESQAALAFLLIKHGVSVSVTISPNFSLQLNLANQIVQPPLAFDNSHGNHRYTQAAMWHRMLSVADRLIGLLEAEVYDTATGETFWDNSLMYFATDFGRTKTRPVDTSPTGVTSFGTSHDLNNGCLLVSPMVNGNTLLGGVDPQTGQTYGFDGATGAPLTTRQMREDQIFAGILQAMGIDTTGTALPNMSSMVG